MKNAWEKFLQGSTVNAYSTSEDQTNRRAFGLIVREATLGRLKEHPISSAVFIGALSFIVIGIVNQPPHSNVPRNQSTQSQPFRFSSEEPTPNFEMARLEDVQDAIRYNEADVTARLYEILLNRPIDLYALAGAEKLAQSTPVSEILDLDAQSTPVSEILDLDAPGGCRHR